MSVEPDAFYPLNLATLPASWTTAWLGDVAIEIQPGFASGAHNENGKGVPHLRMMNVSREGNLDLARLKYVETSKRTRIHRGEILFTNTNSFELVGKTAAFLKEGDWALSNHMTRIRLPEGFSPDFVARQLHLLWMLGYFRHRCTRYVNQASFGSRSLASTVPLILAPVNEQHRIANALENQFTRLDAAVASLDRVRAQLIRYRASVLKDAFEGSLVPPKNTWPTVGIFDVADDLDGRRVPVNASERENRKGDVPYYGATGQVGWIDQCLFDEELVLLGEDGVDFFDRLKPKAYIIRGKSWVNNHAHVLRARPDKILAKFLEGQLNAASYIGLANGTTRLKLTKSAMRRIPILAPPIVEQESVVAEIDRRLSVANQIGMEVDTGLARCHRLRQSILRMAFEGRLVPQDMNDESASATLERIGRVCLPRATLSPRGRKTVAAA
jgi:type I restriction enzyme S subunit